jgi:uncharacterized membrane protein
LKESRIHQIFEFSLLAKGAHAAVEIAGGVALYFINAEFIKSWAKLLTQEELIEDPGDLVANYLLGLAQTFSVGSQAFYAFYLLSHGIIKILLVAGLLRGKLWSYPASLAALALFIVYQLYRYSYTHSAGLIVLTIFDFLMMALIWHEYGLVQRNFKNR